jgi:hypothetical protein
LRACIDMLQWQFPRKGSSWLIAETDAMIKFGCASMKATLTVLMQLPRVPSKRR